MGIRDRVKGGLSPREEQMQLLEELRRRRSPAAWQAKREQLERDVARFELAGDAHWWAITLAKLEALPVSPPPPTLEEVRLEYLVGADLDARDVRWAEASTRIERINADASRVAVNVNDDDDN